MIIREVLPEERDTYNDSVSHIMQSYEWGIFKEITGIKVSRMGAHEGYIKSGFQLSFHPLPHTSYTIGYFPRGGQLTQELIDQILKIGYDHGCVFIKIEPNLSSIDGQIIKNDNLVNASPVLPQHTFHIDLTSSEDEIIERMKEKTRYNIKLAQKHQVVVEEKSDKESLEVFIRLTMETANRQGFFSHPADYYRKLWDVLYPDNMCHLLVARYQSTPLAAIMLFKFKEMLYYPYGGSATVYREKMPNHLLHFEAIKLGKKLGCTTYDMWGSYKKSPTEKDPWFGIYRFKEGFGGKQVEYPQTVDLVFLPRIYKLYNILDPLRFKLLFLKRLLRM